MILEVTPHETCALSVFAAALLTAWNATANSFVWDDRSAVLANDDVQRSSLIDVFSHDFWGTHIQSIHSHKSYRPLTVLSFRLNYLMAKGHSSWLYHFTNVLIHAACSVLVWKVADVLFQQHQRLMKGSNSKQNLRYASSIIDSKSLRFSIGKGWKGLVGALTAGLLFAVHPIHCDAVASIVGRADLLCTLLSLSAFLAYVGSANKHETSWAGVIVALLLTIMAGLCKELGFTSFAILVLYDLLSFYCCHKVGRRWQVVQKRLIVTVLVGLFAACVRVSINGDHRQMQWNILANNIVVQKSRLTRILSYAHVHAWYLWKLLWPRWLCFDYGYNTIPVIESITDPRNVLTLSAYAIIAGGVGHAILQLTGSKRSPLFTMSIGFGVIPFVPASNILFPVGTVVAERLMYFSSVGFCLLAGCIADRTFGIIDKHTRHDPSRDTTTHPDQFAPSLIKPKAFFGAARVVVLICGTLVLVAGCYRSQLRNADWIDEQTLFRVAIDVVPTNVKVLSNEAKNVLHAHPEKAIDYLRVAIGMLPNHIESQTNAGLAFATLAARDGLNEDFYLHGIRHLFKAAMLAPDSYQALGYIGGELYSHWMRKAQLFSANAVKEEFNGSGAIAHATAFLDLAIAHNSSYPSHYYNRGSIAFESGDFESAIRYFQMTEVANSFVRDRKVDLELLVEGSSIYNMLGVSFRKIEEVEKALNVLRKGIELYPEETDLYINAALILQDMGNQEEADAQLKAGLAAATKCEHVGKLRKAAKMVIMPDFMKAILDRAAILNQERYC